MKYLLINLTLESSSILEGILDNKLLKEVPFGTKFKTPVLSYGDVLIPLVPENKADADFKLVEGLVYSRTSCSLDMTPDMIYSVYSLIKEIIPKQKSMSIDIVSVIDLQNIGIAYSDGSSCKNTNRAGYGVCKLTETSSSGVYDDFSGMQWLYETYSGQIQNGTNNIGELSGVRTAISCLGDKKVNVIISDNIYSIKSFREYIYTWKNNGWLAYNKKPIKNKELIQSIYTELLDALKDKIILFKWTKGHNGDTFNELCDKLAKKESGVDDGNN